MSPVTHHLDHATHDHLTTSTVNTDHVTTSTVPHNDEDGLDGRCMEDRARDASADASPFIGMHFFFIFLFLILLMNFIIYYNCRYYDHFNDHHVTPPVPHQRTATATITKTLPPSSHVDVCGHPAGRRVATSALAAVAGTGLDSRKLREVRRGERAQTTRNASFGPLVSFF